MAANMARLTGVGGARRQEELGNSSFNSGTTSTASTETMATSKGSQPPRSNGA